MYEYDELYHHGILGQKWGVRRFQNKDGSRTPAGLKRERENAAKEESSGSSTGRKAFSAKAKIYRAIGKANEINEKFYAKRGNNLYSSMNKDAKEDMYKKADEEQNKANKKLAEKNEKAKSELETKNEKRKERDELLKNVDPSAAKNKATKRAALDYHNMNDGRFKAKYKVSKEKFAKRYAKSDGDTFSMGLKKAAAATAIQSMMPERTIKFRGQTINVGGKYAKQYLAKDLGKTVVSTQIGYKQSEKKYKNKTEQ